MLVIKPFYELMRFVADALSTTRLVCAPAIALLAGFAGHPVVALVLLVVAVFSEPLDGWFARTFGPSRRYFPFAKGDNDARGKDANEMSTGAICGLVPTGILVRAVVDCWHDPSAGNIAFLVVWIVACVGFVLGTVACAKARAQLIEPMAEKAEVRQAWLTGVIYASCAYAVAWSSVTSETGVFGRQMMGFTVTVVAISVLVGLLSGGRLNHRHKERGLGLYTGDKTSWRQIRWFGK